MENLIADEPLEELKKGKNLLAFSAGIDSTALFYILIDCAIDFDCAIVNYHTRKNSDKEVIYAKELCEKYHKKLFIKEAKIDQKNFEANARKIRYDFFEKIIKDHSYDALLTAHQLNDWAEWFLMQFCKGAGFFELNGMRYVERRENYKLIRPLLKTSKEELQNYLNDRGIVAFYDESNDDRRFLRNRFRADFTDRLLAEYKAGIKLTFNALQNDRKRFETSDATKSFSKLTLVDKNAIDAAHQVDIAIKKLGRLTTKNERAKIEKGEDFIAARKIAVCFTDKAIWIAPFERAITPKKFREECRKLKIPVKIRAYIFNAKITPDSIDIP
ncbi:MAG: tRNA lysidine(34) synthetase TilS [Helicobacteraceae bacterium]|jgi:tRNA(Ile)-lysidine synthase|nr:tRNA lysidine(34) synthetase TilS [Helicobacteraceae bacterium]